MTDLPILLRPVRVLALLALVAGGPALGQGRPTLGPAPVLTVGSAEAASSRRV